MLKPNYLIAGLLLIMIAVASYFIFFKQPEYTRISEKTEMNYNTIPLAKLPQNQLWTYKKAQAIKGKAFYEGFPTILDEQAMLELTKHAYQWDKNAMIVYAQIIEAFKMGVSDDDAITLADFLNKYSYELVDAQGKPLSTPAIFNLDYKEFLKILANKGYIEPTKILLSQQAPKLERQEAIKYYKTIIKGGYRYNVALANTILFNGSGYQDSNYTQPIKLIDHIINLSIEEIREALENYREAAIHGENYSMIRLAEAYYYGITETKNYKAALAWTQLANEAYQNMGGYYSNNPNLYFDNIGEQATNQYSLDLANKIKEHLTHEEIEQTHKLADQLKLSIVTWSYKEWVNNAAILIQP